MTRVTTSPKSSSTDRECAVIFFAEEPVPSQRGVSTRITALLGSFSIEITPRESLRDPALLQESLPAASRVYITFLAERPFADTVTAAAAAVDQGMIPVPHVAARAISNRRQLDGMIGRLSAVGVEEVLLIAGSMSKPAGEFDDTIQVLASGCLQAHEISRVGVAGHPEGNKDIGNAGLADALAAKNAVATDQGLDMYLLTQFCFTAGPIVAWERRIRAEGNRLPVLVGLPGLSSPATLLKFGLSCGVGPSLKVLRKQSGGLLKLATKSVYYPDRTLLELAQAVEADPDSLINGIHFFPFGALRTTARWAEMVRSGQVRIDEDSDRMEAEE